MLNKVLVANRGEVAIRIIRACREMGIASVAVYSAADRTALHTRLADESHFLGPAAPAESYLNVEKIIRIAQDCQAEAIHPGYGFLAENPSLAEACQEAGLVFIGPPAPVLQSVGEKIAARRTMAEAGLPIIPGSLESLESEQKATILAQEMGYPVILKAAAGGGGKGMRIVHSPHQLREAIHSASSEAHFSFGDATLYLEKFIAGARHIEVQLLADNYGQIVALGERECSTQRRHQKLVEEAPSPALDEGMRRHLVEMAVKAAQATNYTNAGTIEFLMDGEHNFHFLEMNPRLQVEHPVTELVTGIDIVKEQIRLAAGERLRLTQSEITTRGWALECRIYAEDPENGFLPCAGTVRAMEEPSGPGVRVESGVYVGMTIPLEYDPLLAKVIVWGENRKEAINRMRRALQEYYVLGVKTTTPFHRFVMENEAFVSGQFDTGLVHKEWKYNVEKRREIMPLAAVVATLIAQTRPRRLAAPWEGKTRAENPWKSAGRRGMLRWS